MILQYPNKRTPAAIVRSTRQARLQHVSGEGSNMLIQGDNLSVLKTLLKKRQLEGKVDLIYIDPPFATNTRFTMGDERVSTISRSKTDKIAYNDTLVGPEFLEFLRERLVFLRELLSEEGSIYLHIDYKIGHYVKIVMDEIFGPENFRNDITRIKCNPKNFHRRAYGNIKDLILFYSKGKRPIWNDPREALTEDDTNRLFKKVDAQGRRYTTIPLHAPGETTNGPTGKEGRGKPPPTGRHWRTNPTTLDAWDKEGLIEWSKTGNPRKILYADEKDGKKKQDIWDYKDTQYPNYPTEKNLDLLRHIIQTSSNEDSIVLDCFCGSGTTLVASQKLSRRWIGIDASKEAIRITQERLQTLPRNLLDGPNSYAYFEC